MFRVQLPYLRPGHLGLRFARHRGCVPGPKQTFARRSPMAGNKAAAEIVGKLIAERAKAAGVEQVSFDRIELHLSAA